MTEIKRTSKGQFATGVSGNPKGRLPSVNSQLRKALENDSSEILQQIINAAKAGDMAAAKIVLDRLIPPLKAVAQPIQLEGLGETTSAVEQAQLVLSGVGAGQLPPDLAAQLISALGQLVRINEIEQLQLRLEKLEETLKVKL